MKLINKISVKFFTVTLLIFIAFGIVTLYVIKAEIGTEIDEELQSTTEEVIKRIEIESPVDFKPFIEIKRLDSPVEKTSQYSYTLLSAEDNESEEYRELITRSKINGEYYEIIVRTSSPEQDDLFYSLAKMLMIVTPILFISLYFVNRFTAKQELKPFYKNLDKLKNFSLKENTDIEFEKTNVTEFNDLNNAVNELISRAVTEYKLIIESSENLSHELQTPIAVIKSKLELIRQKEDLDRDTVLLLNVMENNINRLSKINKSLILLMRLENKEVFEYGPVNVKEILEKHTGFWEDFLSEKGIALKSDTDICPVIKSNEMLIDILISNILSNAFKHNIENGEIIVLTGSDFIEIKNTGVQPAADTGKLFERFVKGDNLKESLGLGLSIVNQICNFYDYEIHYIYKNNHHCVRVNFY